MQVVYEQLSGSEGGDETLEMIYDEFRSEGIYSLDHHAPSRKEKEWIEATVEGVLNHLDELDRQIEPFLKHWTLERLPKVDLIILRIGTWEMNRHDPDSPDGAIINACVNLAKTYGEDETGRFINGVLGSISRSIHPARSSENAKPEEEKASEKNVENP
ncbi:MAG: transcription antitermination factor NusB [Clostridia bacterium]|nr:transcription antitermination factor NusB [Clostridia bacterium]